MNTTLYMRLTGTGGRHIMAMIINVAMVITMAVVALCQATTPT